MFHLGTWPSISDYPAFGKGAELVRRYWLLLSMGLCLGLPVVFFPISNPFVYPEIVEQMGRGVAQFKVDHPMFNYLERFGPATNMAKRNFRVLAPMVGHLTATGVDGAKAFNLGMQAVLAFALLRGIFRLTGSRQVALLMSLALLGNHLGVAPWIDMGCQFDTTAYALLAVGLFAESAGVVLIACFLGLFVDERVFTALPLLAIFYFLCRRNWRHYAALGLALGAALVVRWLLSRAYGLTTPHEGVGESDLWIANLRFYPVNSWLMFKGTWVFIVAGLIALWATRRWLWLVVAGGMILGFTFAPLMVLDITRSNGYYFCLPLLALALLCRLVPDRTEEMAWLAGWSAALSLVAPNCLIVAQIFVYWTGWLITLQG